MNVDQILYLIGSMVLALVGYIGRSYMQRIDDTQEKLDALKLVVDEKINERQVRQLLADKLDPLKEAVDAIEAKVDKMYFLMLNNK